MTPKTKTKEKVIRAWAVAWTDEAMADFGVKESERICCEDVVADGRKKDVSKLFPTILTIFATKEEALWWRNVNTDFEVIPVTIRYTIPLTKKK